MNKTNKILLVVVGSIIAAIIFFGGFKYGETKPGSAAAIQGFQMNRNGRGTGTNDMRNTANSTMGRILSKDNISITVQLEGGGSKIIFVSSSTPVMIMSNGLVSNLQIGQNVSIQGTQNPDGTETANTIQVRPVRMIDPNNRTGSSTQSLKR